MIEGLEGSDQCEEYKFHEERGYGAEYTTEVTDYSTLLLP
jgi:hypothetical protein